LIVWRFIFSNIFILLCACLAFVAFAANLSTKFCICSHLLCFAIFYEFNVFFLASIDVNVVMPPRKVQLFVSNVKDVIANGISKLFLWEIINVRWPESSDYTSLYRDSKVAQVV
jgi:hypothetical protein